MENDPRLGRLTLFFSLPLALMSAGCQVAVKRIANLGEKLPITLGSVEPRYSVAPQWNDFYVASAVTSACTGAELDCKHGGEQKRVSITGRTSCIDLVVTDHLEAFDWNCTIASGQVVFYGSLKSNQSLANLVNATGWKTNYVQIRDGGQLMDNGAETTWWSNPVLPLPDSSSSTIVLASAGTIYVAATSLNTMGYNINADKISIAFLPDVTLTGTAAVNMNSGNYEVGSPNMKVMIGAGTQNYVSVEGSNQWSFGIKPTSGWTLDGNLTVQRLMGFYATKYLRLKNLNVRASLPYGIHLSANTAYTVSRLTTADNSVHGMLEGSSSYGNFDHINGMDNGYEMIDFNGPSHVTADWIYNRNNVISGSPDSNAGIWINGGSYLNFTNIELHNSGCAAMTVRSTTNSVFDSITATDSGTVGVGCGAEAGNGIYIRNGSGNIFSNLKVSSNFGSGIRLNAVGSLVLKNVVSNHNGLNAAFTGRAGIRETGVATGVVKYQNITTSGNALEGMSIAYPASVLNQILSTHNGGSGVTIDAAATSVSAATLAYNGGNGINQNYRNAGTVYHSVVAYENALAGIYLKDEAVGATLSQIVTQNNGGAGISIGTPTAGSAEVKLLGYLRVASNTGGACALPPSVNGFSDANCTPSAPSTGVLLGASAITNSFVGATSLTSPFASISDWSSNPSSSQAWGKLSPLRGDCLTGETCQFFDWALSASDATLRETSGNGVSANESFIANATCPAPTYGTVSDTPYSGGAAFLRNAIEDVSIGSGNGDGLCQAGETCFYTPNFGYYQGEGSQETCTYRDNGGLSGITLSGHALNGR